MANYLTLKAAVAGVVKTNGEQAITGANLQTVLLSIINSIGGGGYIFEGVATPSTNPGTPDQNVFYIGGAGTYANFGTSVVVPPTNIAVFKYNGSWTCEQVMVENGGVFDISAFNAVGGTLATYADLAAALGSGGANVPAELRKGGMSVKYVQSSDNKYIQARLMAQNFTTDVTQWQGIDDVPTVGSDNLVKSGGVAKEFSDREMNITAGDCSISDEGGNAIVLFSGGHTKTKNFDSSKSVIKDNFEYADSGISDGNGHFLALFQRGHIRTKNFDSSRDSFSPEKVRNVLLNPDCTIKSFDNNNPISVVKETQGLSAIIQDWGFIGDSLMSGYPNSLVVDVADLIPMPNGRNFYKYSWGQMMCRLTGAFGTNYSIGGQTTKGWLYEYPGQILDRYNSDGSWSVDFSNTHKVAYAINLGVNDATDFNTLYPDGIGSLQNVHSDSDNYTENDLRTYAGCFGKILALCKKVSPSSRLFIITTPPIEYTVPIDIINIQKAIANSAIFTHTYLIDLYSYMENADIQQIYGGGHLYCQGYQYYAYCIMTYIDYIIRNNPTDFKNIQYIEYLKNDTGQI